MEPFKPLQLKIHHWQSCQSGPLHFTGVNWKQFPLFYKQVLRPQFQNQLIVLVCPDTSIQEQVSELLRDKESLDFPGFEQSPYGSTVPSESAFLSRLSTLFKLRGPMGAKLLLTSAEAWQLRVPPVEMLEKNFFKIQVDDIVPPREVCQKLVSIGYTSAPSADEPGTFCAKNGVLDIYPIGMPLCRLTYFDDLVESIFECDPETSLTLKDRPIQSVDCFPHFVGFLNANRLTQVREFIPQPGVQFKNRYEARRDLFNLLSKQNLVEIYPYLFCFLDSKQVTLRDYLPTETIVVYLNYEECAQQWNLLKEEWLSHYVAEQSRVDSTCLLPSLDKIYQSDWAALENSQIDFTSNLYQLRFQLENHIHLDLKPLSVELNRHRSENLSPAESNQNLSLLKSYLQQEEWARYSLYFCSRNKNAMEEFRYLYESWELSFFELHFLELDFDQGFCYPAANVLVLSSHDFFAHKKNKVRTQKNKNADLFAEQISTLKKGDYVIHRDFGIGLYLGMETITAASQSGDFVILEYENKDKVYVPVYKLNLLQKYADSTAPAKLANLQTKKFEEQKAKARASAKKLAFDLLRLQAERKLSKGFAFSSPDHLYKEFELLFPFEETPDQFKAIEDVLEDMQKTQVMDRLVCGDVGFGKTEVAMRAAFKAIEDKKQVAVLVPTTVLALQHYHSFLNRFKTFPVNIEMLSRFKSTKESKLIHEKMARGEVDIVIGTHALLSDTIHFQDLGLLIIDEEHRFGVNHKEKLKTLKIGVDVLTMTATPIPRTLQLSFMGLRDISLIQTPPPKRQSIKTFVIKKDDVTLTQAIEKELSRGGQIFYVHNRVHDIEEHELYLKALVPHARVCVAHGQMPEKKLEETLAAFYQHKFDILLATTIIESGIDIPNANTMIVNDADKYGLAQLHQLRGRIGRSERKAYAYLVVSAHKLLSEAADKRLESLLTYADIGSGFALASCDLEIRGAGELLGAEQSGQIEQIGLELYLELLDEAIKEIKGGGTVEFLTAEISTPFKVGIPADYISDQGQRLKIYKKLSSAKDHDQIEIMSEELTQIYGALPTDVSDLLTLLKCKILFQQHGVIQVKVSGQQAFVSFSATFLSQASPRRDRLVNYFLGRPKSFKIQPDHSVIFAFKESPTVWSLYDLAKDIAAHYSS